jgi:hypothetical protein
VAERHASFILRMWQGSVGDQRLEIEHVQTGSRARLSSLGVLPAWLASHANAAPGGVSSDEPEEKRVRDVS